MHFHGRTDAVMQVEQHRMAVWESTRVRFDMRVVEESIGLGAELGRELTSSRIVGDRLNGEGIGIGWDSVKNEVSYCPQNNSVSRI